LSGAFQIRQITHITDSFALVYTEANSSFFIYINMIVIYI